MGIIARKLLSDPEALELMYVKAVRVQGLERRFREQSRDGVKTGKRLREVDLGTRCEGCYLFPLDIYLCVLFPPKPLMCS